MTHTLKLSPVSSVLARATERPAPASAGQGATSSLYTDYVYVDAEWQSPLRPERLATLTDAQRALYDTYKLGRSGRKDLALAVTYRELTRVYVASDTFLADEPGTVPVDLTRPDLLEFIGEDMLLPTSFTVGFFYSPIDLRIFFGEQRMRDLMAGKALTQKRQLKFNRGNGRKIGGYTVKIHDFKGWAPSVKEFLSSNGIDTSTKTSLDAFKDVLGLVPEYGSEIIDYAKGDVVDLRQAALAFDTSTREIIRNVLKVDYDPKAALSQTTGSLVSRVLEMWLRVNVKDLDAFERAVRKLGRLKPGKNKELDILTTFENLSDEATPWQVLSNKHFDPVYSQTGVRALASNTRKSDSLLAIVQGGRANNERPQEWRTLGVVADIDLKSCYGTSLTQFDMIMGLPTVYGFKSEERLMTLRQFLRKHGKELVPGAFIIYTSTLPDRPLSFDQDLIPSKYVDAEGVRRAYHSDFKEDGGDFSRFDTYGEKQEPANIPGEFALTRRQLQNGIVNYDVLEALRRLAHDQEYSEVMDALYVDTAAVFRASDRVENVDEWSRAVLADKGRDHSGGGTKDVDTRTRAWVTMPLRQFIGPLVALRNEIKHSNKAVSNALKLFINVTYGALASPFFKIGNTVVANNITAKARVGAWLFNKALHTRITATDGGFYNALEVPVFTGGKKPGLAELANNVTWGSTRERRRRGQEYAPLGGWKNDNDHSEGAAEDWEALVSEVEGADTLEEKKALAEALGRRFDIVAKQHLEDFWGHWDITFSKEVRDALVCRLNSDVEASKGATKWAKYKPKKDGANREVYSVGFDIEHKAEHTSRIAAHWGKADYGMRTILGKDVFKIRGAKPFDKPLDVGLLPSPKFAMLRSILEGDVDPTLPSTWEYDHVGLLKVSAYDKRQPHYDALGIFLGDFFRETRHAIMNNTHFPADDYRELNRRINAPKRKTSVGRHQAFINPPERPGVDTVGDLHKVLDAEAKRSTR